MSGSKICIRTHKQTELSVYQYFGHRAQIFTWSIFKSMVSGADSLTMAMLASLKIYSKIVCLRACCPKSSPISRSSGTTWSCTRIYEVLDAAR